MSSKLGYCKCLHHLKVIVQLRHLHVLQLPDYNLSCLIVELMSGRMRGCFVISLLIGDRNKKGEKKYIADVYCFLS